MKKLLLLVFCAIIAVSCSNDDWEAPEWTLKEGTKTLPKSDHPLTKDEVWQLVNLEFFGGNEQNINASVYISTNIVPPAYNLFFDPEQIDSKELSIELNSPEENTWCVVLDKTVNNRTTESDARVIFISEYGDKITIRKYQYFPMRLELDCLYSRATKGMPRSHTRTFSNLFDYDAAKVNVLNSPSNRYAILIVSTPKKERNKICFWNECSLIYQLLTKVYKFSPSKILIFNSDGANTEADMVNPDGEGFINSSLDFDFDGQDEVVYECKRTEIVNRLGQLANTITSNDELFVSINGIGGEFLVDFFSTRDLGMPISTFKNCLTSLHAKRIQILADYGNCGHLVPHFNTVNNCTVATSCASDQGYLEPEICSPFIMSWVNSMKDHNGDNNEDMQVSFKEAYDYIQPGWDNSEHTSQYLSVPTSLGAAIGLEDIWLNLAMNAPEYFENQTTCSVTNNPSGTSIQWNIRKTYWTNDIATTTNSTSSASSITLQNSSNASDFQITATVGNTNKRIVFTKGATSGAYGPHTGALYWNCNSNSGGSSYNNHNTYVELPIGQTTYFYASYYQGNYGNRVNNPTISACDGLDLNPQAFYTNYVTLQPTESGEGDMLIYLDNGFGEGDPFTIPYIVFDQNSYSLLLNASSSSMSLRKKTNYSSKSAIKSVEIQNAERKVLYKKDFYDVAIARVDAERQLDFQQLEKGTYIIKITDDKVHFLKLVI